ncbi:MAG: CvpA family protein [Thermacetogeniaceae bacterium]
MNIIDLIILLILLLGAWGGFRRGLILTCGGLFGFLGGIWLAGRYYITVAQYLGTQLGLDKLFTRILIPFTAGISSAVPAIKATGRASLPGWPPSLWVPVNSAAAGVGGQGMAQMLAAAIVKAIAFFLIMALVSYLVMILASFISRVAHLLLLGGLDRLGGVGLGLGTRALELVVIIGLLTPVVLGLSLGLPVQGGWLHSFFQAWNKSALIPLFNRTWNLAAPSMNNFFTMI